MRVRIERKFSAYRTLIAVGISLGIAFVLIISVSDQPGTDIFNFLFGPLTSFHRFTLMIEKVTPLLFTGSAVALMFTAGQINLSGEGAFFMGAFVATPIAIVVGIPMGIHPLMAVLAAGIAGAVVCSIPGILHVKLKILPVVPSLMLNFVVMFFVLYFILNVLRDPGAGFEASWPFAATARLTSVFGPGNARVTIGLPIGIIVVVGCYLLLNKTTFGYSVRMIGHNRKFAQYSGVKVGATIIAVQVLAGFIAGIGGGLEVLSMFPRFMYTALPGHGWDGILIAVLARNNPKNIPIAVLFLAYIRMSADVLNRTSSVPLEVVGVIQAIIICFVAAERFLAAWEHRAIVKASQQSLLSEEEG